MKREVVIVSACRTPIGSFMGGLATIPAPKLGAIAIKNSLEKIKLNPNLIDEVLMGNVLQAGVGQAPARQAAIFAGIPETVPCTTINKVCASGMKAVIQAVQSIALGDAEIIVAGGMENMSLTPHYSNLRNGKKFGPLVIEDGIIKSNLRRYAPTKLIVITKESTSSRAQIFFLITLIYLILKVLILTSKVSWNLIN